MTPPDVDSWKIQTMGSHEVTPAVGDASGLLTDAIAKDGHSEMEAVLQILVEYQHPQTPATHLEVHVMTLEMFLPPVLRPRGSSQRCLPEAVCEPVLVPVKRSLYQKTKRQTKRAFPTDDNAH
jgi:hypothetical protein